MEFDHDKIWWFDTLYDKLYVDSNITKFNLGRKLFNKRAISYLSIEDNKIEAVVYDGRKNYLEVNITVSLLSYKDIEVVKNMFRENPHLGIELINGNFRKDLNNMMKDHETDIFMGWNDLTYRCSCRKTKKCEHTATVLHRILNEIIYEPMLLFNLRGMKPNDIYAIIMNDPDFELVETKLPSEMTIDHYDVRSTGFDTSNIDPRNYYGVNFNGIDLSDIKVSKLTDSRVLHGKIREEFYDIYEDLSELINFNIKKF